MPPATPAVVAGHAAASAVLQPSDADTAYDLAQRAAQLAAGLDDLSRARASRALAMGAIWVRPELVVPALHEALAGFGPDHPWETALTMQCLTQADGDLSEALRWGRSADALFRQVGDHKYAANTLFIMAQRSIYAGVADDEVHQWLTQSQALAEAAGSDEDRAHATVGFAQLSWLRGDHADAAALMEQVLPTLRRLGDQRCTGRALCLLGRHAYQQDRLDHAADHLTAAIRAVALAGQSFVLVEALETLAAVNHAEGHHRHAAVLLGVSDTARRAADIHMRPLRSPDETLQQALANALGNDQFDSAVGEGRNTPAMDALPPDLTLQLG
jgi:hypothetical protein